MQENQFNNEINQPYIRLAEAERFVPYSKDYLSLLARQGKIHAKKIGRDWHTTREAIEQYHAEQEARRKVLNTGRPLGEARTQAGYPVNELRQHFAEESPVVAPQSQAQQYFAESRHEASFVQPAAPVGSALTRETPSAAPFTPSPAPSRKGFGSLSLAARIAVPLAALMVIFGGVRLNQLDEAVYGVKDFVAVAQDMQEEFVRVIEGKLLRVDEGGNLHAKGNVNAGGQLVSNIVDGVAPLVVRSSTTVSNLSTEYLDGIRKGDISLAFVVRNGATTATRVVLNGGADISDLVVSGTANVAALIADSLTAEKASIGTADIDQANVGELTVSGDSALSDTEINGTLDVSGTANLRRANVNGSLSVDGTLSVASSVSANAVHAGGGNFNNVTVENTIVFSGDAQTNLYRNNGVSEDTLVTDASFSLGGNLTVGGTSSFGGHLTPAADNTHDLGSASLRWRDLYVGPGSLNVYSTIGDNAEHFSLGYTSDVITFTSAADGAGTARPFNFTGANVGIGTASPDVLLDVNSTGADTLARFGQSNSATNPAAGWNTVFLNNTDSTDGNFANLGFTGFRSSDSATSVQYAAISGIFRDHTNVTGDLAFITRANNTLAERARITELGVGIGTTAPGSGFAGDPLSSGTFLDINGQTEGAKVRIIGAGSSVSTELQVFEYSNSDDADLELFRARGTQASPLVVANGDELGSINTNAWTGSTWQRVSDINTLVDGAVGPGIPAKIYFKVSDVSGTLNTGATLSGAGQLALPISGSSAGILLGGDVNLYRTASNRLNLGDNDILTLPNRSATSDVFVESAVSGDAFYRFQITADGTLQWGPGSSLRDTNLYRSAANTLKTDDNLVVTGDLTVSGLTASNGDVDLGDTASDTVTFVGVVDSNILPDADVTRDLGSLARQWNTVYADTVTASNLAGTVVTGDTSSASWLINSDNATANAEVSTLAFDTGSNPFNATLQWNAAGDAGRVSGFDDTLLTNYPIAIYSEVSGGNQTFTSGSLFTYGQNATHAITQSGAFTGITLDFSSNITVPDSANGNQTGVALTLSDGGASATATGLSLAGTADYGINLSGATIGTAAISLPTGTTAAQGIDFGGDVNLFRAAANVLQSNDIFQQLLSGSTDEAYKTFVSGDTHTRFTIRADGQLLWGSGSAGGDTNLYRSAADVLKTDDSLVVAGNSDIEGYAAIGNGSALSADRTLLIDRDISSADNAGQLLVRGTVTSTATHNNVFFAQVQSDGLTVNTGTTLTFASTLALLEPNITLNGTGSVTTASTLYIQNVPTEGTNNYALFVDAGDTRLDGQLQLPTTGSSAGLLIGGDTQLYRSGADILQVASGDTLDVATFLQVGANDRTQIWECAGGGGCFAINDSSGTRDIQLRADGDVSYINTGNGLGIGTTSPDQLLTINDGSLGFSTGGGASDVLLSRGAANRLDLASGDSFNLAGGALEIGGIEAISSARAASLSSATIGADDSFGGIMSLYGNGATSSLGGTLRWYFAEDYDTSADYWTAQAWNDDLRFITQGGGAAQATLTYDGQLQLPTSGSSAGLLLGGDTQLYRGAANRLDLASGDSLNITNGNLRFGTTSTGILDANGNEMLILSAVSSAVNHIQIRNNATGLFPSLTAVGDDTNIGFDISSKGSGSIRFWANNSSTFLAQFNSSGKLQLTTTGSSGGIELGGDFHLYRLAANFGYTPDTLQVGGAFQVDGIAYFPSTGLGGGLRIGGDTNLYRSAADVLATSDSFQVGGDILASLAPTPTAVTQTITTVDSPGTVGQYSSIAIGTDGLPVISYYDSTNSDLKLAKCTDAACTASTLVVVAPDGLYTSIAIGTDGNPVISYFEHVNQDLKVTHCTAADCSTSVSTTLDSTGSVGLYTSIAIGTDGLPVISYQNGTSADLKVAKCTNAACTASTITTLDSTGSVGEYTAIAIGVDGLPVISYYDATNTDLKVVHCGNQACSSGNVISTPLTTGIVSGAISMVIGADGLPIISHVGSSTTASVFKCSDILCSAGTRFTIHNTTNTGTHNSITIGADGLPIVSYYDDSPDDLLVVKCGNSSCSAGNTQTTIDSTGSVGQHTAITIGTDGLPVISYYDVTNTALKLTKCGTPSCSGNGHAPAAGSNIGSLSNYFNNVYANQYWGKSFSIANFDLAEEYYSADELTPGAIVSVYSGEEGRVDQVQQSSAPYEETLMGIVSTQPGITLADWQQQDRTGMYPIALAGRVPVKVSNENGPIKPGDAITSSSVPGIGMKATQAGRIVGIALSGFENQENSQVGTVTVFVNPTWWSPSESGLALLQEPDEKEGEQGSVQQVVQAVATSIEGLATATVDGVKTFFFDGALRARGAFAGLFNVSSERIASFATSFISSIRGEGDIFATTSELRQEASADGTGPVQITTYSVQSSREEIMISGTGMMRECSSYSAGGVSGCNALAGKLGFATSFAPDDVAGIVAFAPEFSALLDEGEEVRVIVTPTDELFGTLYVAEKSVRGFVVGESITQDVGVTFDWVIIARIGDGTGVAQIEEVFAQNEVIEEPISNPVVPSTDGGATQSTPSETPQSDTTSTGEQTAPTETVTEPTSQEPTPEPTTTESASTETSQPTETSTTEQTSTTTQESGGGQTGGSTDSPTSTPTESGQADNTSTP